MPIKEISKQMNVTCTHTHTKKKKNRRTEQEKEIGCQRLAEAKTASEVSRFRRKKRGL